MKYQGRITSTPRLSGAEGLMWTAPRWRLPRLSLPALLLLAFAAALLWLPSTDTISASDARQVSWQELQRSAKWEVWADTCTKSICREDVGTFGSDQDIYIKAKLIGVGSDTGNNYQLSKDARRKTKRGESVVTITLDGGYRYGAPLVRILNRNTLVFHFDIDDESAKCGGGTGGSSLVDTSGIGIQHPGGNPSGCAASNYSQSLGGERYDRLYDFRSYYSSDLRGEFPRFRVNKTITGITTDPGIDAGFCEYWPKRKRQSRDIPMDIHTQCSALLRMAQDMTGVDWSPDVPIEHWNGVKREGVGTGLITEVRLGQSYSYPGDDHIYYHHRIGGRVFGRHLDDAIREHRRLGLHYMTIPQLNIDHRREWERHGHALMEDEAGYVVCYSIKCDKDGNPFVPDKY